MNGNSVLNVEQNGLQTAAYVQTATLDFRRHQDLSLAQLNRMFFFLGELKNELDRRVGVEA